ncbi:MAG: hypothetical protein AAGC43_14515 [Bacteroidota bacterium]
MCRYGTYSYKPHYACFSCKKTFKRRLLIDIDRDSYYHSKTERNPFKCPDCEDLMANMGLDFESPKKSDIKAWNHIKNLFESGITYHSCGCSGPGYIPKNKEKLMEFLNERKEEYVLHRRFWSNRIEPQNHSEINEDWHQNHQFLFKVPKELRTDPRINSKEAIAYWTDKIEELEAKIQALGS